jgi:hypothetical protein
VVVAVVAALAVAVAAAGLALARRPLALIVGGERVEAEVIRLAPVGRGSSPHLLAPVVRLVTRAGRVMEVRGLAEKYPSVGPGDHLPVVYPPEAPERAAIAGVRELWGAPLACLVIAFLLAGTAALLRASERGAAVPALVGGVALLLGVPLLLAATLMAVGRLALLRDGVRASGEVTNAGGRTRRWSQPRSEIAMQPAVVRFANAAGREIRVVMPAVNAEYLRPGVRLPLVYRPERAHAAEVLGFRHYWSATGVLGGLGIVLCAGGAALLRPAR